MPKKPYIRWLLAAAAVLVPVLLVTYAATRHGMIDYIRDYLPLKRNIYILLGVSLLTFVALAADVLERRNRGIVAALTGALIWAMTVITFVLSTAFAAYAFIPMYSGKGDTPPQLMMTEAAAPNVIPDLSVVFYTERPMKSVIVYGEPEGKLKSFREKEAVRRHWIKLAGLKPDTEYVYAVNEKKPVLFRTPAVDGQPIWFAAGGDAHIGNKTSNPAATRDLLREIAKPSNGYDAFFLLGDMAQLGFNDSIWRDAVRNFAPYTSTIPTAILPGNHDTLLGGLPLYKQYLQPPDIKDSDTLWSRLDIGKVHFLLLDLEWELQAYTDAEQAWLEHELAKIPKEDWTIVMCHTFFYSSGDVEDGWAWYDNKTVIDKLSPLFEEHDVDIVMSGHKHDNELLQKNGVTYVVTGAMGGQPDTRFGYESPASVWLKKGAYAFADVTIAGSTATISFIDRNGKMLYRTTVKR
jgi:UDP-2,3-diacylglucosamine pyrophosphatase LpxH